MIHKQLFVAGLALTSLGLCPSAEAVVLYSDNFDDNVNTGWTYLDRSAGTTLVPTVDGGPGAPSFIEQNGQLEQTVTNYSFPRSAEGPQLGGIALSGAGVIGGQYTISVDMTSLEPGNGFQDQDIVFAYVDEDNFMYVETIASGGFNLFEIFNGVRTLIGNTGITFTHDPASVVLSVDTNAGIVNGNYNGEGLVNLASSLNLVGGQVGVGGNNDAFAIDNFVVDDVFQAVVMFDPADLDQDGDVDDADFGIAFAAFTGPNNGPSNNPAADLDGDGDVDDADFGIAFAAFTGPGDTASVPEPTSLALLGLGGLLIARRRRA